MYIEYTVLARTQVRLWRYDFPTNHRHQLSPVRALQHEAVLPRGDISTFVTTWVPRLAHSGRGAPGTHVKIE
jgi:hypothetical protein